MALTGDELISVETALGYPVAVKLSDLATRTDWDNFNLTLVGGLASPRYLVSALKASGIPPGFALPQCDGWAPLLAAADINTYLSNPTGTAQAVVHGVGGSLFVAAGAVTASATVGG